MKLMLCYFVLISFLYGVEAKVHVWRQSNETVIFSTSTSADDNASSAPSTSIDSVIELTTSATVIPTDSSTATDESEDDTKTATLPQETSPPSRSSTQPMAYAEVVINEGEGYNIQAIQLDSYVNTITGDVPPTPGDDQPERLVLPSCPDVQTLSKRGGTLDQFFGKPAKKPTFQCTPKALTIDIHFIYVSDGTLVASDRPTVQRRIDKQMAFLSSIYSPYQIYFNYKGKPEYKSNAGFTKHVAFSNSATAYQIKTRAKGPDVLTVWLVDSITDSAGNTPSGYSFFPGWRNFDSDGVILRYDYLPLSSDAQEAAAAAAFDAGTAHGGVLVHETGHWLGLKHIFGNQGLPDCTVGDDLDGTQMYSWKAPELNYCFQKECGTGTLYRVKNWMSYSNCSGTLSDRQSTDFHSFTNQQRSRMFAHFLTFRRGYQCGAVHTDKRDASLSARELSRRAEGQALALADYLLNNCSTPIQDIFAEDTIPLQPQVLQSYSSAAASFRANPPPESNGPRPSTQYLPTLTGAVTPLDLATAYPATATGTATGSKTTGTGASASSTQSPSAASGLSLGNGWVCVMALAVSVVGLGWI